MVHLYIAMVNKVQKFVENVYRVSYDSQSSHFIVNKTCHCIAEELALASLVQ